jgi:transcriptional regulator with XRE-family HTH domain
MSLGDLAQRSGVTASFLSRVERDETSPSVANLLAICDALGLPIAELFAIPRTTLVRRADRTHLDQQPSAAHVVDTLLTPAWERHVTVLETVAAPQGSGGEALYTMPSQTEVCFVVAGTVEVYVEDERLVLYEGDALTFGAAAPHTWRNTDPERRARILWIIAPGLPDPQGEAGERALRAVPPARDAS